MADNTYSEDDINNGVDNGSLSFGGWDGDNNAYWQDDNGNNYYQNGDTGGENSDNDYGDGGGGQTDMTGSDYWGNYGGGGTGGAGGTNYGGITYGGGKYGSATNQYANNPYANNPYSNNPYSNNPYANNPYGPSGGGASNAGPVTSSWPGNMVFPPAQPPVAPQAPPPQKMTPMLIQQTVLGNDRVQQAMNAGMTIVLDRNNLVDNVPTAMSQVLVPGVEGAGIYKVAFSGPLNTDGTLVTGKTVSYSFPALPNSGQARQVMQHTRTAPVAPKPFQSPSVVSMQASTPNRSVTNMQQVTDSKWSMMLLLPQVITSPAVPQKNPESTSEKEPPYIVYLYVNKGVDLKGYSINLQEVKNEAERIYRENGLDVRVNIVSYAQGEEYTKQKQQGKLPINRHVINLVTPDKSDKNAAGQTPIDLSQITIINAYRFKDYDIGSEKVEDYNNKIYPRVQSNYKKQINYQLGYTVAHELLHELVMQVTKYFSLDIATPYEVNSSTSNNNIFNLTSGNEAYRDHNIGKLNLLHPAAYSQPTDKSNNPLYIQLADPRGIPWLKDAPWAKQMERINGDEVNAIKLFFNFTNMKQMPQLKLLQLKALARESILNFKQ